MIFYKQNVPSREASRKFICIVRRQVNKIYRIEITAEDVQKSRYSHQMNIMVCLTVAPVW